MNNLKTFNEKTNQILIESINNIDINNFEKVLENFNYNKYQRVSNKIQKELDIELFYVKKYKLSVSSLYPLVHKILKELNIESSERNTVLITFCVISVLVRENKNISEKLFKHAKENGINEEDLDKVIEIIKNIKFLFTEISKNFGKNIVTLVDLLSYVQLLIPFTTVLLSLIKQNKLTIKMLIELHEITDNLTFKLLINRIIHRLKIIINTTDKFQNSKNIEPLLVNWELKPPYLKPGKISI